MDSGGSPGRAALAAASTTRTWWLRHAALPALAFVALFAALRLAGDGAVADRLYDATAGWLLEQDSPLSELLYRSERALIMAVALAGLAVLGAGIWHDGARRWRRAAGYLLVCLVATLVLVSFGKHVTNVDCPRAMTDYGGDIPAVGLFEDRPDDLPRTECFPAGHSSAAFSFVSLYFVLGAVRPRWRWAGLAAGLGLGLVFGATQWARGMHFPSHDVCSAAIAWAVALTTYTAPYRRRLRDARHAPAAD